MSERDSVHKEIEKLQEEIKEKNKKLQSQEGRTKHHDDEVSTTVLPTFLKLKIANFFPINAILFNFSETKMVLQNRNVEKRIRAEYA